MTAYRMDLPYRVWSATEDGERVYYLGMAGTFEEAEEKGLTKQWYVIEDVRTGKIIYHG